jgi:hypothetical protein
VQDVCHTLRIVQDGYRAARVLSVNGLPRWEKQLGLASPLQSAAGQSNETDKVARHIKKHEIQKSHPNEIRREFNYNVSHSAYRKDWGNVYEKPGISARSSATSYGPSGIGTSQDRAQLGCRERTILVLRGTLKASEIPKISFVSQPLGRLTDCNK